MAERTLVLVKPDAVQRRLAGDILARFERRGLDVIAAKLVLVDAALAEEHYAEHREKPFFGELVEFITSAPTLALVLEGESAIKVVRTTMGATNPVESAPGTIRGDLALAMPNNLVHGSDSPESAEREIRSGSLTMSSSDLTGQARTNREFWNRQADEYQAEHGEHIGRPEPRWGLWQIPESELRILGDVAGKDVLELGCGAAQWSILLAQQGARMVGLDNSERQLEHARTAMAEAGVDFPLVHASAESVPLPDASFDVVFADHGANRFADPYLWVPEIGRLLRPGGLLAFSGATPFEWLVLERGDRRRWDDRLHRDLLRPAPVGDADGSVEFELPYGEWIRLFRRERLPGRGAARDPGTARGRDHLPDGGGDRLGAALADGADLEGSEGVTLSDHAQQNVRSGPRRAAEYTEPGRRNWAQAEITWGIWDLPESEVGALPVRRGQGRRRARMRHGVRVGLARAAWSAWSAST